MGSLLTVGREFHKGYELMLQHSINDYFSAISGSTDRLKILFIEDGSGVLNVEDKRTLFIGPVLFCLNEKEHYHLENLTSLNIQTVWFHPSLINKVFDFNMIRKDFSELSETEIQDVFWLEVFVNRDNFSGQLNVGPGTFKRVKDLFEAIKLELDIQKDTYWPCRCRTYLIELLFLIQRLSSFPESIYTIEINDESEGISEILLYLYSNYMNKITIDELTEGFHINRTSLNKLFNRVTGMSVINYLIKLRIYLAAQMLRDTTLPVAEIISRVGYSDAAHFGRMFKRIYSCSASDYRERNCLMLK